MEQTLEAVARSVGERSERTVRLTGAGSRDSGSEQPAGHRWWRPGLCSGSCEDRKWSWEAPSCGNKVETSRVSCESENSDTQLRIVSSLRLNS